MLPSTPAHPGPPGTAHLAATPLRAALSQFYADHGLGPDGGATARWVHIRVAGPVAFYFPNFGSRRRSVQLHDMHHVVTGYGTSFLSEAEIAAWEIGGGCGRYFAPWLLNTFAFMYGVPLVPRRVCRAFLRGRRTRNLYHGPVEPSLLDQTVGDLQHRLLLDPPARAPSLADLLALIAWVAAIAVVDLLLLALTVLAALWALGQTQG